MRVIIKLAGVGGFDANATAQQIYEVENVLLPSGGNAEEQRFHYRGPAMVRVPDLATGPNVATISAVTHLWWQQGTHARARTVSLNPGAGYTLAGTRISRTGGAAWAVNDPKMRFLRISRGGRKVIFECPISGNGDYFIDLDIHEMPGVGNLATALQVGDTIEIVKCGAKLTNPLGLSHSIEGHGGCSGPYDDSLVPATRGGGGFWCERLEFDRRFMAWGCWGLSFDRCDFSTAGDENYYGGSGVFVNCLHTSLGMILHGGWSQLHDTANCRPDVAANDGTADPIYQNVDAFSCWGVLRAGCRVFVGSGTSSTPAYLTLERNLASYGAIAVAGIYVGFGSRFVQLDQRSRNVQVQGTGNNVGMAVVGGSQALVALNKIHVLGDGAGGTGFDDARVGAGTIKTWDEFHAGTGLPSPSGPSNWVDATFSFSRLTAYPE